MRCQQLLTKTRPSRQVHKYALRQGYKLFVNALSSEQLMASDCMMVEVSHR